MGTGYLKEHLKLQDEDYVKNKQTNKNNSYFSSKMELLTIRIKLVFAENSIFSGSSADWGELF